MAGTLSKAGRSERMSRVKSRDAGPEWTVSRLCFFERLKASPEHKMRPDLLTMKAVVFDELFSSFGSAKAGRHIREGDWIQ